MQSFGLIVVGPLWGLISVQLFFQTGEELIKATIYLIGLMKHRVAARKLLARFFGAMAASLVCAVLLVFGFWLVCIRYADLRTPSQNVLYIVFAVFAAVYLIKQLPDRLRKAWRHATIPGAIEEDKQHEDEAEAEVKELEARDPANRKSDIK